MSAFRVEATSGQSKAIPIPLRSCAKYPTVPPGLHIMGAGIQRGLELFVQRYAQPFGESGATLSDADWNRLANDSLPPNLSLLNARIVGGVPCRKISAGLLSTWSAGLFGV